MFRFLFAAFALMWMASLFFGTGGAAAGAGLLVLAPLFFLFKFLFFAMLIGFFVKGAAWHRYGSGRSSARNRDFEGWRRPTRRRDEPSPSNDRDRFQEWHDLEHARREVDSWTTYDL